MTVQNLTSAGLCPPTWWSVQGEKSEALATLSPARHAREGSHETAVRVLSRNELPQEHRCCLSRLGPGGLRWHDDLPRHYPDPHRGRAPGAAAPRASAAAGTRETGQDPR